MLVLFDKNENKIPVQRFITKNTAPYVQIESAYEIEKEMLFKRFDEILETYDTVYFRNNSGENVELSKELFEKDSCEIAYLLVNMILASDIVEGELGRDNTVLAALIINKINRFDFNRRIEIARCISENLINTKISKVIFSALTIELARDIYKKLFVKFTPADFAVTEEEYKVSEGEFSLTEEERKQVLDIVGLLTSPYYTKLNSTGYDGDKYRRLILNLEKQEEKHIYMFLFRLFVYERFIEKKFDSDDFAEFLEYTKNYDFKTVLVTLPILKSNFVAYTQSLSKSQLENFIRNFSNKDFFLPNDGGTISVKSGFLPGLPLLEFFKKNKSIPDEFLEFYLALISDLSITSGGFGGAASDIVEIHNYPDELLEIYGELFNIVKSKTEFAELLSYKTRSNTLFAHAPLRNVISKRVLNKLKSRGVVPEISSEYFFTYLDFLEYERYDKKEIASTLNNFETADIQRFIMKFSFRHKIFSDNIFNLQARSSIKDNFEMLIRYYLKTRSKDEKARFIEYLAEITYNKAKLKENAKILFSIFIEVVSNSPLKNKTIEAIFEKVQKRNTYSVYSGEFFGLESEEISGILKEVPHRPIIDAAMLQLLV